MRLHGNVRVQMIECSISFLASLMPAFVHALDFFVPTTGTFVLLRSRNGNKGIHLGEWMWWTLLTKVRVMHEEGQHNILGQDAEVPP